MPVIKQPMGNAKMQIPAKCRVCSYTWTAIIDVILVTLMFEDGNRTGVDTPSDLECPHCKNLTGDADYPDLGCEFA